MDDVRESIRELQYYREKFINELSAERIHWALRFVRRFAPTQIGRPAR